MIFVHFTIKIEKKDENWKIREISLFAWKNLQADMDTKYITTLVQQQAIISINNNFEILNFPLIRWEMKEKKIQTRTGVNLLAV